jgi:ring-1,2-phenylacetyl-CoA epoxidase subunit PaaD
MVVDQNIEQIWELLETVNDPEVPVLSIIDLGIVRDVFYSDDHILNVIMTPTYSGCPAMDAIAMNIRLVLIEAGVKKVNIEYQLSPAWTTSWMSEAGKLKLKAYGIAPPLEHHQHEVLFGDIDAIECPQCHSKHTEIVSYFGSTSCKALCKCLDCKEPFDYFKCHR